MVYYTPPLPFPPCSDLDCYRGLDNEKWQRAKKAKPEAAARLRATNDETAFEEREKVFEAHRNELTAEFKYSYIVLIRI